MTPKRTIILLIVVAAIITPTILFAQDELTLESLSTRIAALTEALNDHATRLQRIEELWSGPGALEMFDNGCTISSAGDLQNETVLKYKEKWDEWVVVERVEVAGVLYSTENDRVGILYQVGYPRRWVTETWSGCEFIESSDWWEE